MWCDNNVTWLHTSVINLGLRICVFTIFGEDLYSHASTQECTRQKLTDSMSATVTVMVKWAAAVGLEVSVSGRRGHLGEGAVLQCVTSDVITTFQSTKVRMSLETDTTQTERLWEYPVRLGSALKILYSGMSLTIVGMVFNIMTCYIDRHSELVLLSNMSAFHVWCPCHCAAN